MQTVAGNLGGDNEIKIKLNEGRVNIEVSDPSLLYILRTEYSSVESISRLTEGIIESSGELFENLKLAIEKKEVDRYQLIFEENTNALYLSRKDQYQQFKWKIPLEKISRDDVKKVDNLESSRNTNREIQDVPVNLSSFQNGVNEKLQEIINKISNLSDRVSGIEGKLNTLEARLIKVEELPNSK